MAQIQMKCRAAAGALLMLVESVFAQGGETTSQVQTAITAESSAPGFEIFCDFRCPFCARMFSALEAGAKHDHKRLDFAFRNFPLQSHPGADVLARYFEAAGEVDEGIRGRMIDDLYSFRDQSTSKNLDRFLPAFSIVHGLEPTSVAREMRSRNVELKLAEDLRLANERKVTGTPTVFLDGRSVPGDSPEDIAAFILEHSAPAAEPPRTTP